MQDIINAARHVPERHTFESIVMPVLGVLPPDMFTKDNELCDMMTRETNGRRDGGFRLPQLHDTLENYA